jgi:hypothetical protein
MWDTPYGTKTTMRRKLCDAIEKHAVLFLAIVTMQILVTAVLLGFAFAFYGW